MTQILHLRARRFHALHDLLTGGAAPGAVGFGAVPDYLARDVGLPERTPKDRHISHMDLLFRSGKFWRFPSTAGHSL